MGSIPDPTCTFYKTSSHTQGPKRFPSDASRTHPDASPSQRRRSEPLLTAAAATLSLTSGRAPISRVERGHVHETSDDVLGPCHEFWDPASCSYNIPADQLKRLLVQASKECCAQQLVPSANIVSQATQPPATNTEQTSNDTTSNAPYCVMPALPPLAEDCFQQADDHEMQSDRHEAPPQQSARSSIQTIRSRRSSRSRVSTIDTARSSLSDCQEVRNTVSEAMPASNSNSVTKSVDVKLPVVVEEVTVSFTNTVPVPNQGASPVNVTSGKPIFCGFCGIPLKNTKSLNTHQKEHHIIEVVHICPYCGLVDEKTGRCNICHEEGANLDHFLQHHHVEMSGPLPLFFIRGNLLTDHLRSQHPEKVNKKDKVKEGKRILKAWKRTYTPGATYGCGHCGVCFEGSAAWLRHLMKIRKPEVVASWSLSMAVRALLHQNCVIGHWETLLNSFKLLHLNLLFEWEYSPKIKTLQSYLERLSWQKESVVIDCVHEALKLSYVPDQDSGQPTSGIQELQASPNSALPVGCENQKSSLLKYTGSSVLPAAPGAAMWPLPSQSPCGHIGQCQGAFESPAPLLDVSWHLTSQPRAPINNGYIDPRLIGNAVSDTVDASPRTIISTGGSSVDPQGIVHSSQFRKQLTGEFPDIKYGPSREPVSSTVSPGEYFIKQLDGTHNSQPVPAYHEGWPLCDPASSWSSPQHDEAWLMHDAARKGGKFVSGGPYPPRSDSLR